MWHNWLNIIIKWLFEGEWNLALQYMADAYANVSSVRDSIEGSAICKGSLWLI